MKKYTTLLIPILLWLTLGYGWAKDHPCLFISVDEAAQIRASLGKYPLLDQSFNATKAMVAGAMSAEMDVPQPGEAGGYAHERHKQNYREMQAAGLLYTITGDTNYASFVKKMLLKYSDLYPTLGPHPLAHNQAPGKLFHQMLNETVWLVYTSMAYDCIYDWLSPEERSTIEKNIFRPIIQWFTVDRAREFNRIHNHGTWSVASIGMLGYVLDDPELVEMALYGTQKDGQGGFLKQLDRLFSPDGYYMEGPYYIRYALRPFFLFAEAVERNEPGRGIYQYRDQILKKAYYSAVQTTFPNGVFPPINDASKTMNVAAVGVVIANDLAYYRYASDANLLGVAGLQKQVVLNGAGLKVARDFADGHNVRVPEWGSLEFTDGYDGKQGGLGILRTGKGADQTMLLMKYGVHGQGHGHFDKLHFILFDQNREVVPDYGFARWINMEPKYGGRYLPENKSYAMQTIAHNTVVVDQTSQNMGERKEADRVWASRHFFDASDPGLQAVSATANGYYPGVRMQRTMFLMRDDELQHPVIIDLYRLSSNDQHIYDYPIHYTGQLVTTNVDYTRNDTLLLPMGKSFGYQHIWQTGQAAAEDVFQLTWVDGMRYYSITSSAGKDDQILFGRIGANDPNFNLRAEPLFIQRVRAANHLFAAVIEPHGLFDEAAEKSDRARSQFRSVHIIGHNDQGSVVELISKSGVRWLVMVNNGPASVSASHSLQFNGRQYDWKGNFNVKRIRNMQKSGSLE